MKSVEQDPDKKWITTWNHYLNRIKLFVRWFYNCHLKQKQNLEIKEVWVTPDFYEIPSNGLDNYLLTLKLVRKKWLRDTDSP